MEAATRRFLLTSRVRYMWEPLLTRLAQITDIQAEITAAMYHTRDPDLLESRWTSRITGEKRVHYHPG